MKYWILYLLRRLLDILDPTWAEQDHPPFLVYQEVDQSVSFHYPEEIIWNGSASWSEIAGSDPKKYVYSALAGRCGSQIAAVVIDATEIEEDDEGVVWYTRFVIYTKRSQIAPAEEEADG